MSWTLRLSGSSWVVPGAGAGAAGVGRVPAELQPRLFERTATNALVPTSAEVLAGHVGSASDDGPQVPTVTRTVLERYKCCGHVCGLALTNNCSLGVGNFFS